MEALMDTSMLGQISALRRMTVTELRGQWLRLYGEPTRSRNRDYLWKRLAWRVQELANSGLSERAKQRIDELAPDDLVRATTPKQTATVANRGGTPARRRDPQLPSPGTVLSRHYHGHEIRVSVHDNGFEWDGQMYGSLSAVARAVTGARWNGKLFFGLTERKRKV